VNVDRVPLLLLLLLEMLVLMLLSCCCLSCFCCCLLQEFDKIQEGELSTLSRLAAEREDSMMWKEFRERLLRNIGLVSAAGDHSSVLCCFSRGGVGSVVVPGRRQH
jgi:hypothetical protein